MKKVLFVMVALLFMTGCSRHWTAPSLAVNYSAENIDAVGTTTETCYLAIICSGDQSVYSAMESGKIGKVHHVETKAEGLPPLFVTITTVVYGEKLTAPRKLSSAKKAKKAKAVVEEEEEEEEEEE